MENHPKKIQEVQCKNTGCYIHFYISCRHYEVGNLISHTRRCPYDTFIVCHQGNSITIYKALQTE